MAQFKSTTFGKISGKYGEALATKSKTTGKNYLRVASEPSNPRTSKQLAHRSKFGFINRALRSFYPVFKVTFGGNPGIRQGINIAFKNAIIGEYPDYSLDYSLLVFTEGALYQTNQVSVMKSGVSALKIDWNYSRMAGNDPLDQVNIICFNMEADQAILDMDVTVRESGTFTNELPEIWAGGTIYCWIYFTSPNGNINSNSQFIGQVQL